MGSVGVAYDNAMAESFFASLECELLDRHSFESKAAARTAIFTYIEGWYNPRRRHSSIGYLEPAKFEQRYMRQNLEGTVFANHPEPSALREPTHAIK